MVLEDTLGRRASLSKEIYCRGHYPAENRKIESSATFLSLVCYLGYLDWCTGTSM